MGEGENKPLVIVGAGGFGREVAWLVEDINKVKPTWNLLGFVDDKAQGKTVEGLNTLGRVALLYKMEPRPWVVIAVGDSQSRKGLLEKVAAEKLALATLIHPTVIMSKNVQIGCGTVICAGSILTTNIKIGESCILNLGCRIGHDTVLGDYVSLMQGVNLAGEVTVREGVYFGLNAAVINRISIGSWSVIGAGAVVVKDIPAGVVAVGVPAVWR